MKTFSAALAAIFLLGACAAPAATPTITIREVTREVPRDVTKEVTREVPATVIVAPTPAPKTATVEVLLWHTYTSNSAEEKALNNAITFVNQTRPDLRIVAKYVPFDQVYQKFASEVGAGSGPDLLIAPDDELGNQVRARLLLPVEDLIKGRADGVIEIAKRALTVGGHQYGIPASIKTVALYYNSDRIKSPPNSTDELLALLRAGARIAINPNCYHNYGFYGAFDGAIFSKDLSTARDKTDGVAATFAYLKELKTATGAANFYDDGSKADLAFREGRVDMLIDGPWKMPEFQVSLGSRLAVAPMPGNRNPAQPLLSVDAFFINANSNKAQAAADAALGLTHKDSQRLFMDVAGWVPVRNDIEIRDPAIHGFIKAAATGQVRPQTKELNGYWANFCSTYDEVLKKGDDPKAAVNKAFEGMLRTNGK